MRVAPSISTTRADDHTNHIYFAKLLTLWPVWRGGNGVRHINEVKLRRARLVLGLVIDLWLVYHPGIYPDHSGPLSLAIPPWVGAMITGDGFGSGEETASYVLQ